MAKFLDKMVGEYNDDGIRFRLTQPFRYITDIDPAAFGYDDSKLQIDPNTKAHRLIIIPTGFVTDFASIPKFLWSLAPPIGKHSKGALIHDWLYTSHIKGRPWADRVFLEAMDLNGTNHTLALIYRNMVRVFGKSSYNDNKKDINWHN